MKGQVRIMYLAGLSGFVIVRSLHLRSSLPALRPQAGEGSE